VNHIHAEVVTTRSNLMDVYYHLRRERGVDIVDGVLFLTGDYAFGGVENAGVCEMRLRSWFIE